jgi:hypothetical protein
MRYTLELSDISPTAIKRYLKIKKLVAKLEYYKRLYFETGNPEFLIKTYLLSRDIQTQLAKLYGELAGEEIGEIGFIDWGKLWKGLTERVTGGAKWLAEQASNLQKKVSETLNWARKSIVNSFSNFITQAQTVLGGWWGVIATKVPNFIEEFKKWVYKTKLGVDLSPVYKAIETKKREIRGFLIYYSKLKRSRTTGSLELKRREFIDKYAWLYNFLTSPVVKPVLFPLIGLRSSELGEIGAIPVIPLLVVAALLGVISAAFFAASQLITAITARERELFRQEQIRRKEEVERKLREEYLRAIKESDYERAKAIKEELEKVRTEKGRLIAEEKTIIESLTDIAEKFGIPKGHAKLLIYGIGALIGLLIIYKIYKVVTE